MSYHLFFSIALVVFALVFAWNGLQRRLWIALFSLGTFCSLLFSASYWFIDSLTGDGINEAVLYHLGTGLNGAGIVDFSSLIVMGVVVVGGIFLVSGLAPRIVRAPSEAEPGRLRVFLAAVLLVVSATTSPAAFDLAELSSQIRNRAVLPPAEYPEEFIDVREVTFQKPPKNIVYLFLEQIERTYLDEERFPGLAPNLRQLESQAMSFTNIGQAWGTAWTIAGMNAAMCGLPLNWESGNSMSRIDLFQPVASCVGDVLNDNGYQLEFMGGASLEFAGKGNFFETHGFDSVEGIDELKSELEDPEYLSPWGLYDDVLYDIASERYNRLSVDGNPFGLYLLTVDTHHPNGHLSRRCGDTVYGDGSNRILNSVHCADKMAGDFIRHILSGPAAENTVLVVASDHLAMHNTAKSLLDAGPRENLLLFFGDDIAPGVSARAGSTLDIAATQLRLLGAEVPAFGFGRDLFGATPTFSEDPDALTELLLASRSFLRSLWSFPQIGSSIVFDQQNETMVLGGRPVGYPALFKLDEQMLVREMQFQFFDGPPLDEQVRRQKFDQRVLWVDYCPKVANIVTQPIETEAEFCVLAGALGAEGWLIKPVNTEINLLRTELEAFFGGLEMTRDTYERRSAGITRFLTFGQTDVTTVPAREGATGAFAIRSAGFGNGESFIKNTDNGEVATLARGITLVGLNAETAPIKLGHFDICAWGGEIIDVVSRHSRLKDMIDDHDNIFGSFAVVIHDSAVCGDPVPAEIFADTGLERSVEIDYRTPYVGFIFADGTVQEYLSAPEMTLAIEAVDVVAPVVKAEQRQVTSLPRIAHGGGAINGITYTSSIDALERNKTLYDYFELDFVTTTDGYIVCLHDWEGHFETVFGRETRGAVSYAEFQELVATLSLFENCTLDTLIAWMRDNPGKIIVPDIKENYEETVTRIAARFPDMTDRFIPQIYQPYQYRLTRDLGYENIIWTLYRYDGSQREILDNLAYMDLFSLAYPGVYADEGLATAAREATGVLSVVHTINTEEEWQRLRALGVAEIMTDFLPADRSDP